MRVLLALAATVVGVWIGPSLPIRINWTGSAPVGLYLRQHAVAVARNDVVEVCLHSLTAALGRSRGYLMAGGCSNGTSPILKQVVAVAGDEVELRNDFLAVNGRIIDSTSSSSIDSIGRPLEHIPFGVRIVRDGEVWVLGIQRKHSWDSRYFGPVPLSTIVGITRPLLTVASGKHP
jgi:conjugative transfer signal peptidase TraF